MDEQLKPAARSPHAILDVATRHRKARKIATLLGLTNADEPLRLLEVGTGCGGIAHYFATAAQPRFEVDAVDIIDQRLVSDGYRFQQIPGVCLPFADETFDVVISNHVIEHVGSEADQKQHLREVRRVLATDGVAYLSVPNRWMAIEPHYHLFGLSWLPRQLRTPYLRLRGRGEHYDCEPLTLPTLETFLRESAFHYQNIGTRAFRETVALEGCKTLQWRIARSLPDSVLDALAAVNPTLIYRLRRIPDD